MRTIGAPAVRPQPSAGGVDPPSARAPRWCGPSQPVSSAKPHVVAPTSFNQAQEVADKLKVNQPVIVNLQNVDRDLSRRIIDFASGLCYGIGGQMERVANQVFLLTPVQRRGVGRGAPAPPGARLPRAAERPPWALICHAGSTSTSSSSSPGSSVAGSRSRPGTPWRSIYSVLFTLTEPVLGPLRRVIPPVRMGAWRHRPVADHRPRRRSRSSAADRADRDCGRASTDASGASATIGPMDLTPRAARRTSEFREASAGLQHPGRRRVPRAGGGRVRARCRTGSGRPSSGRRRPRPGSVEARAAPPTPSARRRARGRATATRPTRRDLKRTLVLAQRTADAAIKEAEEQARAARRLRGRRRAQEAARARAEAEAEARRAQPRRPARGRSSELARARGGARPSCSRRRQPRAAPRRAARPASRAAVDELQRAARRPGSAAVRRRDAELAAPTHAGAGDAEPEP